MVFYRNKLKEKKRVFSHSINPHKSSISSHVKRCSQALLNQNATATYENTILIGDFNVKPNDIYTSLY